MAGGEKTRSARKGIGIFMLVALVFTFSVPLIVYAAATVIVNNPAPGYPVTSKFGRRVSPKKGASSNHRGTDFGTPSGTRLTTAVPVGECVYRGKAGNVADVFRKCDDGTSVKERYFHLTTCSGVVGTSQVRTGATGNVTGPHLHYEVIINGSHVDPQQVFGKNLCDPTVRKQLLDDARNKGIAGGGGGATSPSNPSTPPSGGGTGTGGPTTPPPVVVTPPPPAGPPYTPRPPQDPIDPGPFPPTTDDIVPGTVTDNEVTGCSTEVWRAMVNQSVLQTRREMLTNERYIAKPDSILAYSCFEDFYWYAGEKAGVFSETDRWKNATIDIIGRTVTVDVYLGTYSLDGAIANAVDAATEYFLNDNFDHEWLGESYEPVVMTPDSDDDSSSDDPPALGGDADPHDHGASQYGWPCGQMRKTWQIAKCINIVDDPVFYRFEDLVGFDPRVFPHGYECTDSGITGTMISRARHEEVTKEVYTAYFDILRPDSGECAPPVPTGVQITIRTGTDRITQEQTYDDGVCITAGCSYQNPGHSGLGTCEIKEP